MWVKAMANYTKAWNESKPIREQFTNAENELKEKSEYLI